MQNIFWHRIKHIKYKKYKKLNAWGITNYYYKLHMNYKTTIIQSARDFRQINSHIKLTGFITIISSRLTVPEQTH